MSIPQDPSNYPPAPTPVIGQPGYFPAKVRFETIGEAWRLLQQQMGVWVGAMCIYIAVTVGIYIVGSLVILPIFLAIAPHGEGAGVIAVLGMFMSFFALIILVIAASSVMLAGLYRMAIRQVRGEMIAIGDLFSATDLAVPALIATLLVGLATMVGSLFCVIPAYIVHGLLMLTLPIIADRRLSPVDAMKASWNALQNDILMATLYVLVLGFVAGLGAVACGVGMVVTMPLFFLGTALVYRDFFIAPYTAPAGYAPTPSQAPAPAYPVAQAPAPPAAPEPLAPSAPPSAATESTEPTEPPAEP
jgi:hypothetical protein